jgi:hypothetical protein
MLWFSRCLAGITLVTLASSAQAQFREQMSFVDWRTFEVPDFGTSIQYPASIFAPAGKTEKGVGQRFESPDGRAALSIYSRPNDAGENPTTYLRHNLRVALSASDYVRITRCCRFERTITHMPFARSSGGGSCLWTQAHTRKLPQVFRRQLPSLALGCEFNECPMLGVSCRSDHFGVVEVPDTQKDRDQETYGRTIDLKCDTNLLILLISRIYLDACHCDPSTPQRVRIKKKFEPATDAGATNTQAVSRISATSSTDRAVVDPVVPIGCVMIPVLTTVRLTATPLRPQCVRP